VHIRLDRKNKKIQKLELEPEKQNVLTENNDPVTFASLNITSTTTILGDFVRGINDNTQVEGMHFKVPNKGYTKYGPGKKLLLKYVPVKLNRKIEFILISFTNHLGRQRMTRQIDRIIPALKRAGSDVDQVDHLLKPIHNWMNEENLK
jgi:hypothetical protein